MANSSTTTRPRRNEELSSFLDHLPAIYRQPDARGENFIGRFLLAFEDILTRGYGRTAAGTAKAMPATSNDSAQPEPVLGLEQVVEYLYAYFHPDTAPMVPDNPAQDFLPWLFSWIGLEWEDDLTEAELRRLLEMAVRELYPLRGTPEGLRRYLDVVAHARQVKFLENRWPANMQIGFASTVGVDTRLSDEGTIERQHSFIARIRVRWQPLWHKRLTSMQNRRQQESLLAALKRKVGRILTQERPAHVQSCFEVAISTMEIGCASTIGRDSFLT